MEIEKVVEKLDGLFAEGKGEEAQTLLEDSIREAVETQDDNALLPLLNEMIGYKRETSQVEDSYQYAEAALKLMARMGIEGSTAYATTLLNIANAYRAGGRLADSLACYKEVLALYEKSVDAHDMLFASLYNNISLLYQEMGEFTQAKTALLQALSIVEEKEDAGFEEAVTCANLAATCLSLEEDEEAVGYFNRAIRIFEELHIQDAHYCAALSSMGTYYYKKGAYEKAAACFEKGMEGMKASLGENEYYHRLSENLEACRRAVQEKPKTAFAAGLSLCREYYETYGMPMIHDLFPAYEDKIAVGLAGEGSDCFGYDDAVSADHDWGPGFCLWVSQETYGQIGEELEKAYKNLPKEFKGFQRKETVQGQGRVGVGTIEGFYHRLLGKQNCKKITVSVTPADFNWAEIPDASLAAAVNGEVFTDKEGIFSAVRRVLKQGYPESMFYLKIGEACARFSQAAQYNFSRMAERKDNVAAELSLAEGIKEGMKLLYYMDNGYPPHDKWLYRGIAEKEDCKEFAELFSKLTQKAPWKERAAWIEELAGKLCDRLYEKDIISGRESYLAAHAGELLKKAQLCEQTEEELIKSIAVAEFEAFDKVRNEGGRASCQNDWPTFSIMRKSQYMTWNRRMLLQYLYDFEKEYSRGHNLIEEKYGRMMESTAPHEYAKIAEYFPVLSEDKKQIIEAIIKIQVGFMEEFAQSYPYLADNARTIHTYEDSMAETSYETYLRGEISTYSDKMLELYGRFVAHICRQGKNLAALTMENSVHFYGYSSLEEAEESEKLNSQIAKE